MVTSPYLPIIEEYTEVTKYNIVVDNGIKFVETDWKDFGIYKLEEE